MSKIGHKKQAVLKFKKICWLIKKHFRLFEIKIPRIRKKKEAAIKALTKDEKLKTVQDPIVIGLRK